MRRALSCFITSVTWPYTSRVKAAVAWPRFESGRLPCRKTSKGALRYFYGENLMLNFENPEKSIFPGVGAGGQRGGRRKKIESPRSGFSWERRRSSASELSRLRRSEGYGADADEGSRPPTSSGGIYRGIACYNLFDPRPGYSPTKYKAPRQRLLPGSCIWEAENSNHVRIMPALQPFGRLLRRRPPSSDSRP